MGRIRTIKPEFPQSQTIGRLSRDARLLFIMLWTLADDSSRARASSRMLASLLFPYDSDAPELINVWLQELEDQHCIRRYEVDGKAYLDIPKWLEHQKIDRPTPSRLPAFDEASRALDEPSTTDLDLGPRIFKREKNLGKQAKQAKQGSKHTTRKSNGPANDPGFYAAFNSPELDAWSAYEAKTRKSFPRDKQGGWTFPSRWPPETETT